MTKPQLCVYGTEEDDAICPQLTGGKVTVLAMPGNHHYNHRYAPVIDAIFNKMAGLAAQH